MIACALALVWPAAAAAHGGAGGARGYTSTVDHIVDAHGVDARANANGNLTFTAPSGHVTVVDGYDGEPYLRFADGKVYENERAPTTFINRNQPPPSIATPKGQPDWVEVVPGRSYTWHDHRTHWMASQPPPVVRTDPKKPHHVFDWSVGGTVDGQRFQIVGSLDWAPPKGGPGYQWISFGVIAAGVLYGAFLLLTRRARPVASAG
jgi:hypothetical protein